MLSVLRQLLGKIHVWRTDADGRDEKGILELDANRLSELTEGWIPVRSPFGPAILCFRNCD
jgi:hypothetical protein